MGYERQLIQSYNVVHNNLVTGRPREQIMIREPVLQGLKNDLKNAQATIEKLKRNEDVSKVETAILRNELRTYKERIKKLHYLDPVSCPQIYSDKPDQHKGDRKPTIQQIVEFVGNVESVSENDLFSPRRKESICVARRIVYYLCKVLTQKSFPEIGRHINGRDHTTILHGFNQMEAMRRRDKFLDEKLKWYEAKLTGGELGTAI